MFDKLIELFINSLKLFMFWSVVRDFEGGVILRFGHFHRIAKNGWNWMWPFNVEELFYCTVTPQTKVIGPQSLTTKDGKEVVVSAVITFAIEDVKKFLLEVSHGHAALEDCTYGVIGDLILESDWQSLLDKKDIAGKMEIAARRRAKKYGVEIQQLALADFTKSRSIRLLQAHVEQMT
jgi:regulator of protease activity HflC (stomatin/prohibitin superfamily)